ncbi:hypothetical protein [Variovorax sp. DXTD-1]|uniref:hypothetical protein n=1 Tax=Variovorax sp. DXTD-1 TaxID=2495592 RepID=UPI000F872531|nr:hypothetical protein [Variovorax sp. DXTD-1]RST54120.1 hypothetical protein EJI00_03060 [Variovorax sp. DXTD-1]
MRSPPPLADEAVDRLFSALVLRYGTPFLDRWRDLDLAVVKHDWALELACFAGNLQALRFGLDHLPEKPPTVMDFKRLCHAMPATVEAVRYSGNVRSPTTAEREAMRELSARIKAGSIFAKPGRQWAADLIRDDSAGWRNGHTFRATPASLAMARDALREPLSFEETQP